MTYKLKLFAFIIPVILLTACTLNNATSDSKFNTSSNESRLQSPLADSYSSPSSPSDEPISDTTAKLISLKNLFPDCNNVCAYDSDKILISRKDKLTVFNIETLQTVKDVTVSTEPVWVDRLSDSFFYYSYDNHYVVLDKDFKQVNQFIVPEQKYSFHAISPSGNSLTYLSDDYRLMYVANANAAAQDIGDGFYTFQYLDENHLITAYPYDMEYRIIDLENRDVTAYSTTAIFPTTLSGGKLLTGEESVSAELPYDNVVRVITAVPPFNKYHEFKLDSGEYSCVTLSTSGKYILEFLSNFFMTELPNNSAKFTSYNAETGEKLWSEVVSMPNDSVYVYSTIYFDSLNTIVYTVSESYENQIPTDAYILRVGNQS